MSRRRPGNGSATLLDMLSNLFYFSLFLSGGESAGGREGGRERTSKRKGCRRRGRGAPSSTYLLPSAHVDAIFQYRVKRALSFSFTPCLSSPSFHPGFSLFRLTPSFFPREGRENGSEARETRKREERSLVGDAGREGERKRGATVSFGCNERTE